MWGKMRRVKPSWAQARPFLVAALALAIVYFFFFWRMASLTTGLGPGEYASRQSSQSVEQILTRGINAPYHLLQHALLKTPIDDVLALRATSVVFALFIFICLYGLLRSWFGQFTALFATVIFATTPWVVLSVRTATPNIMLLWPILLLALFAWISRAKRRPGLWWLLLGFVVGIGLYIPGVIWFLLAAALIARRTIMHLTKRMNMLSLVAGMTIAILLIAPLILSFALEPIRIRQILLIPSDWQSVLETLKSIGWSAAGLFWHTQIHIDIGIDRLPVLNILQITLMVFGLYALSSKARNLTVTLVCLMVFAIIASGINQKLHLLLLGLPAVAVFIGAGVRYLYIEWRRVFPFNPFAHALAIGLIMLLFATHLLYAARYTLIAWPHTTETRNTYVLK